MTGETPSTAKEVFLDALELEGAERESFLDFACSGSPELRERVEALLEAHERRDVLAPMALPSVDLEAGALVGAYRLVERLGEGGFGVVWRAEQEHPVRREVALKVIKLGMDTAQVVRRFDAERQTLAMMDHPGIARVFDAGATEQGRPYFVMELVRGVSIVEHCARERAGLEERLRLFVEVCQAVQHAHQKGVIHRDLKPSNILVTRHDGRAMPKVIDFGIAKATRAELVQQTLLTEHGQFVGSPAYMAPEQMQLGGQDVDTRADVYSLGVVLYELLTGSQPFDLSIPARGGYEAIFRTVREQEPERPSTRVGSRTDEQGPWSFDVPAARLARALQRDLDWIVLMALEKDRSRRYESVGALAADVRRFLADEPVQASPPSALYRLRKTARRHRITVLTLGAVSLALAVGAGLALVGFLKARDQERIAVRQGRAAHAQELLAEEARGRAEEERDRASAVVGLLQKMMNAPGSERAKGPDYTVRALLEDFAHGLGDELADQPLVEATIRATIGNTYLVLGLPAEARPHLVRARELRRGVLGPHHADTLVASIDFARLLTAEGRYEEAVALFRTTLPELEQVEGLDPHLVSFARSQMAVALGKLGAYDEAEALVRQAHAEVEGRDLLGQAVLTNNLASLAQDRGEFDQAKRLFLEALDLHGEASRAGVGDPVEEAKTLENLGLVLISQERLDEAESYLRQALARIDALTGEDSDLAWRSRHNLGRVLTMRGRLDEAEPLLESALESVRATTPPGHPDRGAVLGALSLLRERQGRRDESLALALQALEIRRAALGPDHPDLASSLYNVGDALRVAGRLDEAERYLREALRIVLLREAGTPYRPRVYSNLALVREAQGDTAEALELMARSRTAALAIGDATSAALARQRAVQLAAEVDDDLTAAAGLLAGDLFDAAEPRAFDALDAAEAGPDHRRAQVLAARVITHAESWEESEAMLLEVWDALTADPALARDEEATRREAGRALLELYTAWDRPEELASWHERLAAAGLEDG